MVMEMRLIDADVLMIDIGCVDAVKYGNETAEQRHNSYSTLMKYEIADYINDAETIDAVQVVRCKDCKHLTRSPWNNPDFGWCKLYGHNRKMDYYCASGEKVEE